MESAASAATDHDLVFHWLLGGVKTQALRAVAGLSIAEHLEKGPLSAEQIAEREDANPAMTFRLLRTAAAMGLVEFDPDSKTFAGRSPLRVFHPDSPYSLKHFALMVGGPVVWLPLMRLPRAVAQGHEQSLEALGSPSFDYLGQHLDEARIFSAAMTDVSSPVIREAVPLIDVNGARHAVDVGGANGIFISELLQRNSQLSGAVYDLPHVVPGAVAEAERRGLSDRFTGIAGDFFESVPSADIYLLKFILHDWEDESCTKLLSNIARAMNPGARVLIVEMVTNDESPELDTALMDLTMMSLLGGQERSVAEYRALLGAAGLTLNRVLQLRGAYAIIESTPA